MLYLFLFATNVTSKMLDFLQEVQYTSVPGGEGGTGVLNRILDMDALP